MSIRNCRFRAVLAQLRLKSTSFIQDPHGQTGTDQAHERRDPAAHVTTLSSPYSMAIGGTLHTWQRHKTPSPVCSALSLPRKNKARFVNPRKSPFGLRPSALSRTGGAP